MKKIIFMLLIMPILLMSSEVFCATYYMANNPCSGNAGWVNGSNSNNGTSKSSPFLTLIYSLSQMNGGDILIIDDGTYIGSNNKIDPYVQQIPYGSLELGYTVLRADNDGKVIIDGQGTERCIYIRGNDSVDGETGDSGEQQYIELRGIISKNSNESGIIVSYANHIKLTNCGSVDPADGNTQNFVISYSTYVLTEGCYAWGSGRYKFASFHANHSIFRNCVSRFDRSVGPSSGQPTGDFAIYSSTDIEVQNCIAIDGGPSSYKIYMSEDQGTFGCPTSTSTLYEGPINFNNCISLNNTNKFTSVDANTYKADAHYSNCVGWGTTTSSTDDFINAKGDIDISRCTFGSVDTQYSDPVTFSWCNGWTSQSFNTNLVSGCIWYDFNNGGLFFDIETSNNNNIFLLDTGYDIDIHGTTTTNTKTYSPLDNGLLYLTRIEASSQLEIDGIGATIIYQYGKLGTLWGETGYNLLQDGTNGQEAVDLWPFPNENVIRTAMAAYTYDDDSGGDPEISGSRGFCAATANPRTDTGYVTLTSYIWEYLGNTDMTAELYSVAGYDLPTITVQGTSTSTSSGTITGTYTIDPELSTGLCTWSHSSGSVTGFATVLLGVVSGTVTGLPVGETTVSFSLLDSENQEATDTAVFTRTSEVSNSISASGVQWNL